MQSKLLHRSFSFVSACSIALAVLGVSLVQAAEFKPFLTLQTAGPGPLIEIAEKFSDLLDPTDTAGFKAQAAPYKNLRGVSAAGTVGLAIQTNTSSPLGIGVILSLPISDFQTFNIPGMEDGILMLRAMAQRAGNKYTIPSPLGNLVAYQKQGYLLVATEDAAEFAATADPKKLFAEVDNYTAGIHLNLENITAETIQTILGNIGMLMAMQGMGNGMIDTENLDQVMETLDEASALTYGVTVDSKTLSIFITTRTVAKKNTSLAEKFLKSKEAQAKTKLGAFLPDTPQTILSYHYFNYFTDKEIDNISTVWELISEGLMTGLLEEVAEDEKIAQAADAFLEYVEEVMDFFAQEKLLDSAFCLDSDGTFVLAIATTKTGKITKLNAEFYGSLLEIFSEDESKEFKEFIEGKTKRNYETIAGYSLSCVPNLFADLPADGDLPDEVRESIKNIPLCLFWAVKENEAVVYAAGLDFAKAEQTLKGMLGKTAAPVAPKLTGAFGLKALGEFLQNTVLPLMVKFEAEESDIESAKDIFTKLAGAGHSAAGNYTEEYTNESFTQNIRIHGDLITAYVDILLKEAVMAARGAAKRMQCTNNIKQIVLAFHQYHDTFNALPPLYTVDKEGKPLHSWRVLILPYIEEVELYEAIRLDEPWDSEHNKQFHDRILTAYQCPDNPGKRCCYAVIAGEGLIPAAEAGKRTGHSFAAFQDGLSNTLAIIEVEQPFCWMDPTADVTLDELVKGINGEGRCGSFHVGGCNIGLFDGSVRFVPETIDKEILRGLGDLDDGKELPW